MIRTLLFITCLTFCLLGYSQHSSGESDPIRRVSINPVSISVFPNPATHYFRVTEHDNIDQVIITDLMGKKVKSFPYQVDAQYNVQDLRKGMYLVQIVSLDSKVLKIQRLIKNAP
ncbi:MAG: T9SS type A sorting domain-containing protein [Bacteroidia bacterium]|nr:T9SS type A sorting domain-containing protein [Bacteroidia bacterium]